MTTFVHKLFRIFPEQPVDLLEESLRPPDFESIC